MIQRKAMGQVPRPSVAYRVYLPGGGSSLHPQRIHSAERRVGKICRIIGLPIVVEKC
jgi:hypothetical protein